MLEPTPSSRYIFTPDTRRSLATHFTVDNFSLKTDQKNQPFIHTLLPNVVSFAFGQLRTQTLKDFELDPLLTGDIRSEVSDIALSAGIHQALSTGDLSKRWQHLQGETGKLLRLSDTHEREREDRARSALVLARSSLTTQFEAVLIEAIRQERVPTNVVDFYLETQPPRIVLVDANGSLFLKSPSDIDVP